MNAHASPARCHEFCFAKLDTLVLVEQSGEGVTIRTTRDTFSARRKEFFIHELAAEGFIYDDYQRLSLSDPNAAGRIRWLVDASWLKISPELIASTRRCVFRLLGAAAALWVVLMAAVVLGAAR